MRFGILPFRCLVVPVVLALLAAVVHAEVWTDKNGRPFDATLVRVTGKWVVFVLPAGKEFSLPFAQLSQRDQLKLRLMQPQNRGGSPLSPMSVWKGERRVSTGVEEPVPSVPAPVQKPLNFGYAWPMHTRNSAGSQVKVVSEDAKSGRFIYESPHYRFVCDIKLNLDVLRQFSVLFETTYQYVRALPLAIDGGVLASGKLEVMLYESPMGYARAGGMPGSAACYIPSSGVVLAPLMSLGVKRVGNSFSMDMQRDNSVLIHELAHQLTPTAYSSPVLRNGWFFEGLAEYIASTPYNWGYFRADPHGNAVLAYVTAKGEGGKAGRQLGKTIQMPRLRSLFHMSYRDFAGRNGNVHYGTSLLLVHYFLHLEGNGDARNVIAYLKGLREGRQGDAAVAPLLPRGGYEQLEKEFASAWRRKGIEITFVP